MKKTQKRHFFSEMKLNTKFTIICLGFVIIPIIVFSVWLFLISRQNLLKEKEASLSYKLDKAYTVCTDGVGTLNMSIQLFMNDQYLMDFLTDVKHGTEFSTEELLWFYNRDVSSLERMVNNNAALYQVRVYVDDDTIHEMMPVIYKKSRLEHFQFAEQEEPYGWHYGYQDLLFSSYENMNRDKTLISCMTPIQTSADGELGVVEASMYMSKMFPIVYDSDADEWSCYLDEYQQLHFKENFDTPENVQLMEAYLEKSPLTEENGIQLFKVENSWKMVGYHQMEELHGTIFSVYDIQKDLNDIYREFAAFASLGIILIILLVLAVDLVVKGTLRKFYDILRSIRIVQEGNLDVVIEDCGKDEIGELGTQINHMLSSIKQLTDNNLKHQLLLKNTEIQALQNQINAHFIYNVLESIKMMAEIDEKYEISDAITALGKLLRYSMRKTVSIVSVEEELAYIRDYLKLINLRFDYEIYLSENIQPAVLQQKIPKMTMQPIVENAIYHGIADIAEDTNIYIKGYLTENVCKIEITDCGKGMSEEEVERLYRRLHGELETSEGTGNGIGLKNVHDRIQMNYGADYGLEINSKPGCYTKVTVLLPHPEKG